MADAEARREARRRKILQNSENRMNRLLGKNEDDVVDDRHGDQPGGPIQKPASGPVSASPLEEHTDSLIRQPDVTSRFGDGLQSSVYQRTVRESVSDTDSSILPDSISDQTSVNSVPNDRSSRSDTCPGTSSETTWVHQKAGSTSVQSDPVRILDLLRVGGSVLAAFLTRWSLRFGLGILFFEWVLLPFLILEGCLYYFKSMHMKDIILPHKSSMMAGALILSGVKPDVINSYNKIMGYITAVMEDFAMYFFSFLVFNALMA